MQLGDDGDIIGGGGVQKRSRRPWQRLVFCLRIVEAEN